MDVRQLRHFAAVARHGHFTRAAEASFISQPALSQQIQALEQELGAPLFDRLGRRVELTTAGRVLLVYAERVLRDMESARAAVLDAGQTVRGELSVAAVPTANLTLVVEAAARLRERHPEVRIRVLEERGAAVTELVRSGQVNVGVAYLPLTDVDLETEPLLDEELVLVLPAGDPRGGRAVRVAELAGVPLLLPPEGLCLRSGIDRVLQAGGVGSGNVMAALAAPESLVQAVRCGLGATLLPAAYLAGRVDRSGITIARLVEPTPIRTLGLIRRADRHLCNATRAFMQLLAETASTVVAAGAAAA
jgi:LysR family transcriptional regulator, cyn operon transcriptional activator